MKRMYRIPLLILLLILLAAGDAWGQQSAAPSAYSGTEYLIAFPPSDQERTHQFMGLLITSEFTTNGWIEIPDVPDSDVVPITSSQTRPFFVRKGETVMIEIPRTLEPKYSDEASLRTVRLVSQWPVSVSVINARQTASGGYPALPVDRWGKSYLTMALPAPAPSNTAVTSQLLITAVEDGTEITIYPTAKTTFWQRGQVIRPKLDAKQTYLLQADALPGISGARDLSGTLITSNKPIGVVAGHVRAALSSDPVEIFPTQTYSAWHASMQMPQDREEFGKEYFSVPMRAGGDRFRLMAWENNTTVQATLYDNAGNVAGERTITIQTGGQVVDVHAPEGMALNGPVRWSGDKPFSMTQLRLSSGDNSDPKNSPAMIRLVPTSRYSSRSVFALPTSIKGNAFGSFGLRMVASGSGNPFESITIDGVQATQLPNATVARIAGDRWLLRAPIGSGSHAVVGSNGVTFTGHVSGDNGAISGVALAWELPHWSTDIQADVTPPRVAGTPNLQSPTSLEVIVTDSTAQYFSGVEIVEIHDSPGWELVSFDPPINPLDNAAAYFRVRNGVDPSGPLSLLLRDYDGNESIVKVHDGVCQKTAYPDASSDNVEIVVSSTNPQETKVRINASPCGDEAHIESLSLDPVGSAYAYLEDPVIDGGSTTILPNGYAEITLRTEANIPGGTYVTDLLLVIDGKTTEIPITLKVEISSVASNDATAGENLLNVAPNPAVGRATLLLAEPLGVTGRLEITDARGALVRLFIGKESTGTRRIEWDGAEADGRPVAPGIYFVTLNDQGKKTTRRIVLIR